MIDAAAFGAELAGIVKAATAPLLARIEELERRIAEPTPVPDLAPVIAEMVAKAVAEIPAPKDGKDGEPGRDGLDLKDLFRAEGGNLIAVMSDGTTKDLGKFVGKDGTDGKDGENGKDGATFDDFTVVLDDVRPVLRFYRDGVTKDVPIPGFVYRGVFREGEYHTGDTVSFGGNVWIAKRQTREKPADGGDWQLAVRKGRDGKDGELKAPKERGPVKVRGD